MSKHSKSSINLGSKRLFEHRNKSNSRVKTIHINSSLTDYSLSSLYSSIDFKYMIEYCLIQITFRLKTKNLINFIVILQVHNRSLEI